VDAVERELERQQALILAAPCSRSRVMPLVVATSLSN
jgi:hypothetical protein